MARWHIEPTLDWLMLQVDEHSQQWRQLFACSGGVPFTLAYEDYFITFFWESLITQLTENRRWVLNSYGELQKLTCA
jgi:hypothetical protein